MMYDVAISFSIESLKSIRCCVGGSMQEIGNSYINHVLQGVRSGTLDITRQLLLMVLFEGLLQASP